MRILISNDDGVHAPGIHALADEFSKNHDVFIVAPERERSTTGHSLTLHKPLRIHQLGKNTYSVSGGPADCIYLGISEVLKDKAPDLILSGINRGANLGQDIFLSGTASAAREGANLGIPSIATSLALDFVKAKDKYDDYFVAAKLTNRVVQYAEKLFSASKKSKKLANWPYRTMLNVNIPHLPENKIKGMRLSTQGVRVYGTKVLKRRDSRGKKYFWIGGTYEGFKNIKGSDCSAVDGGYVSISPLELNTTNQKVLIEMNKKWPKSI
ncbi:MAG: 5'/3'-nucleotidase SurE [Oligoflexia bacterium]|nr:5'/3'-nucleotidase SurE [Oligoflexia bacterium]